MKDDFKFLRLWDLYSPLLTATHKEITELYFNYDLSLGEIAEQKGVSRQSVSDCLNKSRKQLEKYEQKLCFAKALDEISLEYSAYMTEVKRFLSENHSPEAEILRQRLDKVHQEFGVETVDLGEGNEIVGKTFREEK